MAQKTPAQIKARNPRYWRNLLSFTALVALLGGLALLVRLGHQGAMAFVHPQRDSASRRQTPADLGIPFQSPHLVTQDGIALHVWYTPPQNGVLILIAHGYGGSSSANMHAFFVKHGFGALSWDARAHGTSGGDTTTIGYNEIYDVEAVLNFARARPEVVHIGAYGVSMGGATVIRAAAHFPDIEAVVSDSAFAALDEMLPRAIPTPMLAPFVRWFAKREVGISVAEMRPVEEIAHTSPRPVLIIHGEADEMASPDAGRRLFKAAGEPRFLWTEPGVEHTGMQTAYPEEYAQRVIRFFETYLPEP